MIMFSLLSQTVEIAKNKRFVEAVLGCMKFGTPWRRPKNPLPAQRKKILFESLEPRLLLSADLLPGAVPDSGGESAGVMAFTESSSPQINFAGGGYQEDFISTRDVGDFSSPLVAVPPRGGMVYAGGVEGFAEPGSPGRPHSGLGGGPVFQPASAPGRWRPASGNPGNRAGRHMVRCSRRRQRNPGAEFCRRPCGRNLQHRGHQRIRLRQLRAGCFPECRPRRCRYHAPDCSRSQPVCPGPVRQWQHPSRRGRPHRLHPSGPGVDHTERVFQRPRSGRQLEH
ncbi:MAG: LEPR-XLL domain-containing protein [Sulfuritalea sp.]|nr:LEPR-XLL domain-containing protein [Sulfuritalea sp.]